MAAHDQNRHLAAVIAPMAHLWGLTAVAEGIETEVQCQNLRELECNQAQGSQISRQRRMSHW